MGSIGDLLLQNQMPNGAWPWIYDPIRGTVVEPYELYSVHQDSMAMIGMHGFGASAPSKDLMRAFGFTVDRIVAAAKSQIAKWKTP